MGKVDRDRVEMCRRALVRARRCGQPRSRPPDLACCASRARGTPTSTSACRWRTQAVDIARRTGDRAALVDAIRLCHEAITMPQTLDLRRQWDAEACDLADDLGDPIARLHVNDYRSLTALEAGDLATMRDGVRHLRVRVRAGRATAQPMADRLPPGVAADARRRPRRRRARRDRSPEPRHGGRLSGRRDHGLRRPDHRPCAGCRAGCTRWSRSSSRPRTTTPDSGSSAQPSRAAMSLDEPHEKVRRAPRHRGHQRLSRCSPTPRGSPPRSLWATCRRAAAAIVPASKRAVRTTVAVARPVRDHAHHGPRAESPTTSGLLAHTLGRHDEADRWFAQVARVPSRRWKRRSSSRRPRPHGRACSSIVTSPETSHGREPWSMLRFPTATERGYGYVERDARALLALLTFSSREPVPRCRGTRTARAGERDRRDRMAAEVRCIDDHEVASVLGRVVDDREDPSLVLGGRRAGRDEDAFAGLAAGSELRGGGRA